jgi:hypothetical protein
MDELSAPVEGIGLAEPGASVELAGLTVNADTR